MVLELWAPRSFDDDMRRASGDRITERIEYYVSITESNGLALRRRRTLLPSASRPGSASGDD